MESNPLVLSDPNLLAEFARESQFKTFFEKRFAAPPDVAALLFRDGALIDAYKGTQFSMGGMWENMKGMIGGSHHYAIMLASVKPFQVQFPIRGMSRDDVEIVGEATLELQLNPEMASNILGLMHGVSRSNEDPETGEISATGRKALSVFDVQQRLEPQFRDRVFESALGRHDADDIRGNNDLQDKMQADMMTEAERIAGDLGILVRNSSITWAMNDAERQQFEKARIEREQSAMDHQLELLKRQVARQDEATEVKLTSIKDMKMLERASEDELRHMVLQSEVGFVDAREAETRRQEAEALDHQIFILGKERAAKFAMTLEDEDHGFDVVEARERTRAFQRDTEELETEHQIKLKILQAKAGAEISDIDHEQDSKEARDAAAMAAENLRRLNDIDGDKADRDTDRTIRTDSAGTDNRIREKDADTRSRTEQIKAASTMSADQLSAITAGFSPEAAQAAIATAQARASKGEEMIDIVRQMTAESREHEHRILETGMKGASGVAAGAGGKAAAGYPSGAAGSAAKVECPNCGKVLRAKDKFCTSCSHQLRT